jgi:deoxyribonuclease V
VSKNLILLIEKVQACNEVASSMILAVDVGYSENGAKAVGAIFPDWESETIHKKFVVNIPEVEEYVPGQFFDANCLVLK